jgi:hypothetical protein
VLAGHIVLAGGRFSSGHVSDEVLVFDAGGTQPDARGRLARPVADGAPVTVGGVGYLVGGEDPAPRAVIQRLTVG